MNAALELTGVHKSFDGNPALVDAFFSASWGEVHALLGENGAGKSSLMNVACGLYAPDRGSMKIAGQPVTISGPLAARGIGIGMVHQHFKLVETMTVAENILLGHGHGGWGKSLREIRAKVMDLSDQIGFAVEPEARIDTLSVSEQQRVEIIKALIHGTKILILDEPTAVLTDEESARLLEWLRTFAQTGAAIVLITHKLREVFGFADRVTVMRGGHTVEAGKTPAAFTMESLSRLMVGEARDYEAAERCPPGPIKLELTDVHAKRDNGAVALNGLSLKLHQGQVYGLAGVGGNGQTELAEILMGLRDFDQGTLLIDGAAVPPQSPHAMRTRGLACVPAERYLYGLAGDLSVMDNYVIAHLSRGGLGGPAWIRRGAFQRATEAAIERFNIQGTRATAAARLLSGGNAQKLVLARELSGAPRVLLAHSPTRGLDVRACAAVHRALRDAVEHDTAVLLISEDLDEVLAIADRIGVINRGRIVGEYDAPAERQAIGRLMVGHA
jgi:simple sugar transport system ATP-binding protein